ncbi:bacterial Ig-like domain-containing protein [Acholeplasma laidlawii]|uniref:bacterial Ig-like domain-containing protein n=1 Tax=Acholeplasma laidlawii TaxID=2148 RepID=UPI00253FBED0|nr:bacterial Ig-like domain-containing protein [Acholeplasma laidlawii]
MGKKIFSVLLVFMVGLTLILGVKVFDIIIDDGTKSNIVDARLNDDNELIFELSDGTLINVGDITGRTGEQGIPGVEGVGIKSFFINDEKKLIVTLTDDTTFDLGVVVGNDGQDGTDGVSITGASLDLEGNLILTLSNGTEINAGLVMGKDGLPGETGEQGIPGVAGVGIKSIEINADKKLIVTLTNDEVLDLGVVVGNDGQDGTDGLSAYQIYLKYNVNYNKTEAEWLTDLVRGKLSDSDTLDVLTYEQLLLAISSGETKIQLQNNIFALETVEFTSLVNINFNGYTLITLESIEITTSPTKVEYEIGEELDLEGLVVTAIYDDESTEIVEVTTDMISGFDSSAAEESQVVTVTYEGKTATFTVTILEAP